VWACWGLKSNVKFGLPSSFTGLFGKSSIFSAGLCTFQGKNTAFLAPGLDRFAFVIILLLLSYWFAIVLTRFRFLFYFYFLFRMLSSKLVLTALMSLEEP
jgi:hypothetical protein